MDRMVRLLGFEFLKKRKSAPSIKLIRRLDEHAIALLTVRGRFAG